MPVYQRGRSWMASVGSGANRWRDTFATRELAEAAELRELLRRKEGPSEPVEASPAKPKGKTLKDAYELTWKLQWKGTKSEKTMKINATSIMNEIGEDTVLSTIDRSMVIEAIEALKDRENTGATINRKLSCLSVMLKQSIDQESWGIDRLIKIPRQAESSGRIRWMNEAEEAKALAACEFLGLDELGEYIPVAIDTGFRRSELLGFKPRDYFNGMLHLHHGETKNGDARAIPATARVHHIIQKRIHLKTLWGTYTLHQLRYDWEILRAYMGMADDPQFVVHMLRHTCASRLVQRRVPIKEVQAWMGHKNINTTLRYAHLAPDSLQSARAALEASTGPVIVAPVVTERPVEVASHEF